MMKMKTSILNMRVLGWYGDGDEAGVDLEDGGDEDDNPPSSDYSTEPRPESGNCLSGNDVTMSFRINHDVTCNKVM